MRKWIFSLVGLILPIVACASTASPPLLPQGVWQGTLGTSDIVACFNAQGRGGSYYYGRYLQPISLQYDVRAKHWYEYRPTSIPGKFDTWQLDAPHDGSLHGTWSAADGGHSFPIKLTMMDGAGDPKACARDSYAQRLDSDISVIIGKRVQFGTHAYRTLDFADTQAMQILDGGSAATTINRQLKKDLDRSPAAVADFIQIRRQALGDNGTTGEAWFDTYPVYWTSHWLMIDHYSSAAGYGRRGISWTYSTWDLVSGKRVNPWDWFAHSVADAKLRKESQGTPLPARLRALLFKGIAGDDAESGDDGSTGDCESYDAPSASYDLTLGNYGFHFDQPAYGDGCDHSFVLPYANAMPLLTASGKRIVQGILSAGEKSK